MDLLFFIFIALILLVIIISEGSKEKKKVNEDNSPMTYEDKVFIECNLSNEDIGTKIRNEE